MQEEVQKYDALLTKTSENYSKMIEKLYKRDNVSVVSEVKEIYLTQHPRKPFISLTFLLLSMIK